MSRGAKIAAWAGVAAAVLVLLLVGALLVLTQTDWGREQVRRFALDRIRGVAEGEVEIGRIEGDLLRRVRLVDVSIVDLQGRPFVQADTIETGYSIRALFRQRIELTDLRLVRPIIVLDQPPDEKWNFARIFPIEPVDPVEPGWGDWIMLRDAEIVGGRVTIRAEWKPPEDLPPAERERAIAEALGDETRANVQRVPGGFQNVMDFRRLHMRLPRVRVADPDEEAMLFAVSAMSGIAQPFRPPVAEVHDLDGEFRLSADSLWFEDVRAVLPGSNIQGDGVYELETGELLLRLAGSPVAMADLRWLYPPLPEEGGGELRLTWHDRQRTLAIRVEDADLRVGRSELAGKLGLVTGDTVLIHDTDLRFSQLDTRLLDRVTPPLDVPRHGRLTGRLVLDGPPSALAVDGDIAFDDERAGTSRVLAQGALGIEDELRFRDLRLRLQPLQTDLVRGEVPQLPAGATISGRALLNGDAAGLLRLDGDLTLRDPRTGVSRVVAVGGIDLSADDVALRDLRLRFEPLQADLVRDQVPDLPPGGTLAGNVRLDGRPADLLHVDGALSHRHPRYGLSRVAADGGIAVNEEIRFRELDLRFDPLRMELVRAVGVDVPLGGTLTGSTTLSGSPGTRLVARGDLVHEEAGERSRVAGEAELAPATEWVAVDLRLLPLSLVTAGRLAPEAALRGEATGRLRAEGNLRNLAVNADLEFPDGGWLAARGTIDVASERPGYDLDALVWLFDLAAVTGHAPAATSLGGVIAAEGRGFDPATMRAALRADLAAAGVDDVDVDSVRVRLAIADGLARVDTTIVRLGTSEAVLGGTFGLVAGRHGELRYRVAIDSLHVLAPYLPDADPTPVEPRPLVAQAALEEAQEEAEQAERRRRVERMATGRPVAPPDAVAPPAAVRADALERTPAPTRPDTVPPARDAPRRLAIPGDALAGRVDAAGALRGNLQRFDLLGRAELEDVLFRGNYVAAGWADYALLNLGTVAPGLELEAAFDSVLAGGFAFDSAAASVRYRGARHGTGSAVLTIRQDEDIDYRADLEFSLALERNEMRVHDLALRFDTVNWRSTRPGLVTWDAAGVEVENLELRSDHDGRLFVHGRLPVDGTADLDVEVERLEIAHVVALLQEDVDARGILHLDAEVEGTLASPRLRGELELLEALHEGRELPDTRATFAYADLELTTDAELLREGVLLGRVEGSLPIDLSLANGGPRLLEDGAVDLDIRADSLPLDGLPAILGGIDDVRGRLIGQGTVRGTVAAPVLEGEFDVVDASFRVVDTDVRYRDVSGALRLDGDRLVIDSLVVRRPGFVLMEGELDLATLTRPGFDFHVSARNALVFDNDMGELRVDAELDVRGPFDGVEITGEVHTRRGVFYLPEPRDKHVIDLDDPALLEGIDPFLLARRAAVLEESPLLANLQVNVDLYVSRDTWVRTTDMNVEVYTPPDVGPLAVHLDQAAGRLTVEGTLNSDLGEYEVMSRRFEITQGTATFMGTPELDPLLQIVAEHEVRIPGREGLRIRLLVGGTAEEPTITLESTAQPPIPETDLLSFIAFGRAASTLFQQQGSGLGGQEAAGGDLVGNVAGLASQQLAAVAADAMLDEFESEAARALGLDVFHIAPADLPAELFTGRFADLVRGTEIEAGSYIAPRLFVSTQVRPTFEVRPGVRVEYRTLHGFRWTTSWEPRYLAPEPTLREVDPIRARVFGAFLFREWRF